MTQDQPSPIISQSRQYVSQTAQVIQQQEHQLIHVYNQTATCTNHTINQWRTQAAQFKTQYPTQIIVGSTVAVALFSLAASSSRFVTLRNSAFAGLGSSFVVAPSTVVGLILATKDVSSPSVRRNWKLRGNQSVIHANVN